MFIGILDLCVHLICMRARSFLHAFFTVLIVAIGFLVCSSQVQAETATPWSLKDLDGKTVNLSDFKGKIVVLNFWATWCPPCRREIPDFVSLQKEYQGKGVVIIGLSVDSAQPSEVAAFVKKVGINYPIVMSSDEIAQKYGAGEGIPVTCFIAPDGTIASSQLGMVDKDYLETQVKKLLPSLAK